MNDHAPFRRHPVVYVREGRAFANSRDVAGNLHMNHDDLMEMIAALIARDPSLSGRRFLPSTYTVGGAPHTPHRCYEITRSGMTLLSMQFRAEHYEMFEKHYLSAFDALGAALPRERDETMAKALPAPPARIAAPVAEDSPTPFQFEGRSVRIIEKDGEPWFVLVDVCRELEIANSRDAASRLDADEKGVVNTDTLGGPQDSTVISEPGLYRLVVQRRARRVDARLGEKVARFQRWVFHDVLPTIRRHGGYGPAVDPMRALADPATLRGILANYVDRVIALEAQVEDMRPSAAALERIARSEGSLCITDAAKTLQLGPKRLFRWLRAHGWIYTRGGAGFVVAYQNKIEAGYLDHKVTTVIRDDGSERTFTKVRVTPRGLSRLAREFEVGG